jgi:hypothetical protein
VKAARDEIALDVEGDMAGRLRSVDGKGDAALEAEAPDLPDRLDRADDVGPMVDDDQAGRCPEKRADPFRVDESGRIEGDVIDLDARIMGEVEQRAQDGVVLEGRRVVITSRSRR